MPKSPDLTAPKKSECRVDIIEREDRSWNWIAVQRNGAPLACGMGKYQRPGEAEQAAAKLLGGSYAMKGEFKRIRHNPPTP